MITIDILTKNGTLVKLDTEEAEEVYQALKTLFDKTVVTYPVYPVQPYYPPVYPNWQDSSYCASGVAT